jgi:hypothetical protein
MPNSASNLPSSRTASSAAASTTLEGAGVRLEINGGTDTKYFMS